jgi:hypothetical protein
VPGPPSPCGASCQGSPSCWHSSHGEPHAACRYPRPSWPPVKVIFISRGRKGHDRYPRSGVDGATGPLHSSSPLITAQRNYGGEHPRGRGRSSPASGTKRECRWTPPPQVARCLSRLSVPLLDWLVGDIHTDHLAAQL